MLQEAKKHTDIAQECAGLSYITSYPVKLVSRSLPMARIARLRLSWFTLGVVLSVLLNALLLGNDTTPSTVPVIAQKPENNHIQSVLINKSTPSRAAAAAIKPEITQSARVTSETKPLKAELKSASIAPSNSEPSDSGSSENASEPQKEYPVKVTLTIESGDTLSTLLEELDVSSNEARQVVKAMRKHYDPKRLNVGQDINIHLDSNPTDESLAIVKSMQIPLSVISSLQIVRDANNDFAVTKKDAKVERKPVYSGGTINSSLYETGARHGIPASVIARVINAYSYDVDFQREIRSGDRINVLYEKLQTVDGKNAGTGKLLYAKLNNGSKTHRIYRFTDSNGDSDFYNEKGESVRKGLLRTPVNGARITSGYGMRRHPIKGYSKMHKGVDFGAPTGTPIYAAGDGKVTYAGRKGGYGNYLRIKHNGTYSTAYAHIHRFASGVRQGKKVKQGQVVAYVGSTGMSTGPHLHYEILVNGKQRNPSTVKFKAGNVLKGKQLASFKKHVTKVDATITALEKGETTVAMLEGKNEQ